METVPRRGVPRTFLREREEKSAVSSLSPSGAKQPGLYGDFCGMSTRAKYARSPPAGAPSLSV
jgi:hypothetical protein